MPPPEAEFEKYVRTLQAERRLPSVSAAVFRGGEPLWQLAVGLADVEAQVHATPDTQYRIGSITKTFTAVAILQLRDAGRLDIAAPVAEYVPELPDRRATIKDVLSHASGLQREEPGAGVGADPVHLARGAAGSSGGGRTRAGASRGVALLEHRLRAAR